MEEKCLVFIKPEAIEIAEEIFNYLDNELKEKFEKTKPKIIEKIPEPTIREHYTHLKNMEKFPNIINEFTSGKIIITVYSGEDIIKRIREIVGPTDPSKAPNNTVRGKFGKDSLENANKENRGCRNTIHASGNTEDAEREIKIWAEHLARKLTEF